jgi:Cu(I)/Ag(I) efflux system periplasmic protein CusF
MTKLPVVIGLAAALTACGQKAAEAPAKPAEAAAAMPAMGPVSGHGTAIITAIDMAAGTVTLDHGPIPEAKWPAMTMDFNADPALLASFTAGDKVAFGMTMADGSARVTALKRQ